MLGLDCLGTSGVAWLPLVVALSLLATAVLRLFTVLIQTAEAAGRLRQLSGTVLGALVAALSSPGGRLQGLASRSRRWVALFHPFGFGLALISAVVAWLLVSTPLIPARSDAALPVLAAGLAAYAASAVVVIIWPPGRTQSQRLRQARQRVARQLAARIVSAGPTQRPELVRLRKAALTRIDTE